MHKVLVISYLFPPSGGVGVPRAIAYARYLPQHSCQVSVLTARRPATAYHDPELAKLILRETRIYRTFNPELPHKWKERLWRRFSARGEAKTATAPSGRGGVRASIRKAIYSVAFPDTQSAWVRFAMAQAKTIVERENIDTVVVIAPPYSLLNFAVGLKRSFPQLRVITDLRDDWLGYYADQAAGPSDYSVNWSQREWQKAQALERTAFELSDRVSIATPAWVRKLRLRYPDLPAERFFCTTNGYEPQDFTSFGSETRRGTKIKITYFGTLNTSPVYSPETFLKALDAMPAEVREQFCFEVIGRVTPECRRMLEGRSGVQVCGFMAKQQGIERLRHADLLLLIATGSDSHAGKLFDYLATGKPILALSPTDGEIAKVLQETGAGWCIDPWSPDCIRECLLDFRQRFLSGASLTHPDAAAIERYSWPSVVAGFARHAGLAPAEEMASPPAMAGAGGSRG